MVDSDDIFEPDDVRGAGGYYGHTSSRPPMHSVNSAERGAYATSRTSRGGGGDDETATVGGSIARLFRGLATLFTALHALAALLVLGLCAYTIAANAMGIETEPQPPGSPANHTEWGL